MGQQPVALDFWGSWCSPRRCQAPLLSRYTGRYRGRVLFVGLNYCEGEEAALAFIREFNLTFPSGADAGLTATEWAGVGSGCSWSWLYWGYWFTCWSGVSAGLRVVGRERVLEALRERYAKGEIDQEIFRRMQQDLKA